MNFSTPSCPSCRPNPKKPRNNWPFYIEYRTPDIAGYFISSQFKDFETAQAAREEYINGGATEALIKKKN